LRERRVGVPMPSGHAAAPAREGRELSLVGQPGRVDRDAYRDRERDSSHDREPVSAHERDDGGSDDS
jgi:hypothetical protein